jgi:tripartite-type tricarboxylate transporter receptor subunit TctC
MFCFSLALQAQTYPVKPVRVIATVAAGTATDITMRLMAPRMAEAFGQPIIVENVAALGGSMGAERLSHLAPDGYNLMITTPSSQISIFFLKKQVPYRLADFTPITAAVEPVTALLVNPNVPAPSLKEFLEHSRRNPGKLSYGSPGVGSVFHLVVEALQSATGTRMLHVPYKSLVTAINDVVGGQTDFTVVALSNVRAQIASGKLRALAVMEGQRYAELPGVPSVSEIVPNFEKPASWFGLFGPAGLPSPVTQRIQQEAARALNAPEVRSKLDASGMNVIANTPEEFGAMIRRGFDVYGAVVKAAGLQPED